MKIFSWILFPVFLMFSAGNAQEIAVLKYQGGGDWYSNPTSLPNLINFCNTEINTAIQPKPQTVTPGSIDIFQFPYVHMTDHGNVFFSEEKDSNLRQYLLDRKS